MTRRTDALQVLTLELRTRSSSPSGRRALRRLTAAGIDVGDATSLVDLVNHYHRDGPAKDGRARAMLEGLLGLATSDPDAALCSLVALRPALRWVASRVYGPRPTDDELAELVALAWAAICDGRPKHGSQARRVVLVTRSRARTMQRRRIAERGTQDELDDRRDVPDPWADPAERSEPLLEAAVHAGVLSRADAELIALTRAVGIPLAALAHDYQCTEKTLLRRRQRAESALRNRLRAVSGSR
jgi:hypothetical protein